MPRFPFTQPLPVPSGGVNVSLPEPQTPAEFLWKGQNMLVRFGQLRTRPGYRPAVVTGPGERIIGGAHFKTGTGVPRTVASGLTKMWLLGAGGWSDITGGVMTGSPDDPCHCLVFTTAGTNLLICTNNHDAPMKWDGVTAAFSALGGSPPIARDLTGCFNRVVLFNVVEAGVRSASRGRISAFNDPNTWPAGLVFDTNYTQDDGVGLMNLTRTTFAIYKEKSIWIATGQAGTFPFALDVLAADYPGPLNPSVIVSAAGAHFYLGLDYRINMVTALGAQPVSDRIDKELQTRVQLLRQGRAWGLYRRLDQTVWFFFPSLSNSDPDQAVSMDIRSGALHFHQYPLGLTAGWAGDTIGSLTWDDLLAYPAWTDPAFLAAYPTWDSMGGTQIPTEFVASADGQVHRSLYDVDDNGTAIPMAWELPPKPWAGPKHYLDFDAIESSFEQVAAGPGVSVDIGVSEALAEGAGPAYTEVGTHQTALATRQLLPYRNARALRGRFMSVRYRCTSSLPVRWKGGVAYAQAEEAP